MNETRIAELLHELASDVPLEVTAREGTVLRRSRRRRAVVAATGLAVAVAIAVGGAAGLRTLAPERAVIPALPNPGGGGFAGLWPETDAEQLAAAQAAVEQGHEPWRTDPELTARALAVERLGWTPDAVTVRVLERSGSLAVVEVSNPALAGDLPAITVGLAQLGDTGPTGIWSVVRVTTPLIGLDPTPTAVGAGSSLVVSGTLAATPEPVAGLRFDVWPERGLDPSADLLIDGRRFEWSWPVAADGSPGGRIVVWFFVLDASGGTVGATAVPFTVEGAPPAPSPVGPDLPGPVAATRGAIAEAARVGDFEALAALLDPDTFVYNFDDGSNPVPLWREDPSVLEMLVRILEMPPAVRHTEDFGDLYVWPYFVEEDLATLAPDELDLLATLGISRRDVRAMIEYGGYTGPRTTIAADGRWLNFVIGGD